jgi:hypothetical protein
MTCGGPVVQVLEERIKMPNDYNRLEALVILAIQQAGVRWTSNKHVVRVH